MKTWLSRPAHALAITRLLRSYPVVAILGARQVGKTSLAREIASRRPAPHWFDLESDPDLARLQDPMLALERCRGLVVLDEVQNRPQLFPTLRVLADRPGKPARFLVLGSASPDLLRQTSESLAGRIAYYELPGFDLEETGIANLNRLWLRGGFPLAYVAGGDPAAEEWRRNFIRTFVERDLPRLGITIPGLTLARFWTMLAHYHGQVWNGAEFGRAFGVSHTTVRKYLDLLSATFMVRLLRPWFENTGKRVIKSPKFYISDSGLLHSLLGLRTARDLESHPKVGASWEGFLLEQVVRRSRVRWDQCYFWGTHAGAELDLLICHGRHRIGVEFKRTVAPALNKSMRIAMQDLRLSQLYLVHAGKESFPLERKIRAVAAADLLSEFKPLR